MDLRKVDEILGTTNTQHLIRRLRPIYSKLWEGWRVDHDPEKWELMKDLKLTMDGLMMISKHPIPCDHSECEAPATHTNILIGFHGDQDMSEFWCSDHLP